MREDRTALSETVDQTHNNTSTDISGMHRCCSDHRRSLIDRASQTSSPLFERGRRLVLQLPRFNLRCSEESVCRGLAVVSREQILVVCDRFASVGHRVEFERAG